MCGGFANVNVNPITSENLPMTQPSNLPLSGIRVLEMGQLIAGPFAGQMLAAFVNLFLDLWR